MIADRILCRADAGRDIGFGHILRCVNLLEQMKADVQPVLAMRRGDGFDAVAESRRKAGWAVVALPEYADMSADVDMILEACDEHDVRIVLTDLCHRNMLADGDWLPAYHRRLRQSGHHLVMSIEDCRCRELASDIAVVPYECGRPDWVADLNCTVLAGFSYTVLSAPVAEAAASRHREVRDVADRVLVCIGGGDPLQLSLRVTRALAALETRQPRLRVLIGPGVSETSRAELKAICKTMHDASIHDFGTSYIDLLYWADVLVCGEGLMRFDAAATGMPTLVISQFDHDSSLIRHYFSLGVADLMGAAQNLTQDRIGVDILSLLNDRDRRTQQSHRGKALIDGLGPNRIQDVLSAHVLAGAV